MTAPAGGPSGATPDCGHVCCDERSDPLHDHFLRPQDCPSCVPVTPGAKARPVGACWCGDSGDRNRVHRAHECVPWVQRDVPDSDRPDRPGGAS